MQPDTVTDSLSSSAHGGGLDAGAAEPVGGRGQYRCHRLASDRTDREQHRQRRRRTGGCRRRYQRVDHGLFERVVGSTARGYGERAEQLRFERILGRLDDHGAFHQFAEHRRRIKRRIRARRAVAHGRLRDPT
jgi:hypothetical protein